MELECERDPLVMPTVFGSNSSYPTATTDEARLRLRPCHIRTGTE